VRFHGLFDDDMSTLLYFQDGKATYSFFNVDSIFDFLLSIDMKPIVELSFMPEAIASGKKTVFHYKGNVTPPKDYMYWYDLIKNLVQHLIDRYGLQEVLTWYFECWNEPNLDGFWNGTQAQYFQLLKTTYDAIKSVNSKIAVGGPASSNSSWIPDTLKFCEINNMNLTFISTHEYPSDRLPLQRDIMKQVTASVRSIVGPNKLLFYTEYNSGLYGFGNHDIPFAAAFVIKNVADVQGIVDVWSYWTFSDIFEEGGFKSTPFQDGFGMLTIHKIPKPVYRAFELLHQSGDIQIPVASIPNTNVDILATILNKTSSISLQILVTNYNVPDAHIDTELITLSVKGITSSPMAQLKRIDDDNANAIKKWESMGSPEYLKVTDVYTLQQASKMYTQSISYDRISFDTIKFQFSIPPQGVVAISLEY